MLMILNEDIRKGSGVFPTWFLRLRAMVGCLLMEENGVDIALLGRTYEALGRARDVMYTIFCRYFIQPLFHQFVEILVTDLY